MQLRQTTNVVGKLICTWNIYSIRHEICTDFCFEMFCFCFNRNDYFCRVFKYLCSHKNILAWGFLLPLKSSCYQCIYHIFRNSRIFAWWEPAIWILSALLTFCEGIQWPAEQNPITKNSNTEFWSIVYCWPEITVEQTFDLAVSVIIFHTSTVACWRMGMDE